MILYSTHHQHGRQRAAVPEQVRYIGPATTSRHKARSRNCAAGLQHPVGCSETGSETRRLKGSEERCFRNILGTAYKFAEIPSRCIARPITCRLHHKQRFVETSCQEEQDRNRFRTEFSSFPEPGFLLGRVHRMAVDLLGQLRLYPLHEEASPSYGTAGFRSHADLLPSTLFR